MMSQFRHLLYSIMLLTSAMWRMAREDPRAFREKIVERIRASSAVDRVPRRAFRRIIGDRQRSKVEILFDNGAFGELASLQNSIEFRCLSRSDRRKVERARERSYLLSSKIPSSVPTSCLGIAPKVIYFLTNSVPYTQSGYTFRSHETAKALVSDGVDIVAVTRFAYPIVVGKFPKRGEDLVDGVRYIRQIGTKYPGSLLNRNELSVKMLLSTIRAQGANIIHTTTDYNNALVVSEAANRAGVPWVYEVRGELESTWLSRHPKEQQESLKQSDFYLAARALETECMKSAAAVIALSEVSRKQLIGRGVNPDKILVFPNAVDEEFIGKTHDRAVLREELGLLDDFLEPDATLVGTVTSIVGYEGIDDLLHAASLTSNISVLIVGEGIDRPRLEHLVQELGMEARVLFVGRQPNSTIWKWYGALDAFVVPRKDTQVCRTVTPIKALMAQALGVEIITSDIPALREITGGLGTYVTPESPESLARALAQIAPNQPRNPESIIWASEHTWKANASRLSALYNDLLR